MIIQNLGEVKAYFRSQEIEVRSREPGDRSRETDLGEVIIEHQKEISISEVLIPVSWLLSPVLLGFKEFDEALLAVIANAIGALHDTGVTAVTCKKSWADFSE